LYELQIGNSLKIFHVTYRPSARGNQSPEKRISFKQNKQKTSFVQKKKNIATSTYTKSKKKKIKYETMIVSCTI